MHRISRLLVHARRNAVAYLALFVALGGTSYAAVTVTGANIADGTVTSADLRDRSVRSADIRNNSLRGADIRNNSLRGADIRNNSLRGADIRDGSLRRGDFGKGQLPAGPRGRQGGAGPRGSAGLNGEDGAPGPRGERGPDGAQGAQGPQGERGPDGAQGAQGPQGERGPEGAQGAQDPAGDDGVVNFSESRVVDNPVVLSGEATVATLTSGDDVVTVPTNGRLVVVATISARNPQAVAGTLACRLQARWANVTGNFSSVPIKQTVAAGEFATVTLTGSLERRSAGSDNYDVDLVCQNSSGVGQLNIEAVTLQAYSLR